MNALLAWTIGVSLVATVVAMHHSVLRLLHRRVVPRLRGARPMGSAAVVLVLFAAHVVESQLFGTALWVAAERLDIGGISGRTSGTFVDYLYLSLVSYTSLGLGMSRRPGTCDCWWGWKRCWAC